MARKSITETLRQAIEDSGYSQNQLSILSGVNRAQICRFVNEERTLTLESAEKIAQVLELELKPKKKKEKLNGGFIMSKKTRSDAWKIQYQNTKRLNEMKKAGRINDSDYQHLKKWTRKLYEEALKSEKLKEIEKILEE